MEDMLYKGYVVYQTDTTYTVVSERDKSFHTILKKNGEVVTGSVVMPDGHICNIEDKIFNPSMIYSACREYISDLKRHKKRREKVSQMIL
jgi:hypothetical protein